MYVMQDIHDTVQSMYVVFYMHVMFGNACNVGSLYITCNVDELMESL